MLLADYDRVVVLCVDKRYLRERERVAEMLKRQGVPHFHWFIDGDGIRLPREFYDQITPKPPRGWIHGRGAYAHFVAMKIVIKRAKDDGVENLLWMEDDCYFRPDFDHVVAEATRQMISLPRWDLLYYGANHTWAPTEELAPNVLQCFGSYTTHCLGIRRHMFDGILALPESHVIDNVIAKTIHHSYKCYAIWPNTARQKPGHSYISNAEMNYEDYYDCKGSNWL